MNRSFRRTIAPAMLALLGTLAALARASADAAKDSAPRAVHHYVFFNRDRERIAEPTFIQTKAIEGAQLKYSWRELEQGTTRSRLIGALLERFEVTEDRAAADVDAFLEDCERRSLLAEEAAGSEG